MSILQEILVHKRKEVDERKGTFPVKSLEQSSYFQSPAISLREYVLREDLSGIIAEIKRKSPSRGVINQHVSIEQTAKGYVQAGASALSILTDERYFGGSNNDLTTARQHTTCPILRKEFVIDEYQIIEAKSIGANAVLLIAAALEPAVICTFTALAHSLNLEVLLEVHNEEELNKNLEAGADLIGVNNRNLKTFELNVGTSKRLSSLIPDAVVKVSESGIESPEAIIDLKNYGYRGFLIGQTFMQTEQPASTAKEFINKLYRLQKQSKR